MQSRAVLDGPEFLQRIGDAGRTYAGFASLLPNERRRSPRGQPNTGRSERSGGVVELLPRALVRPDDVLCRQRYRTSEPVAGTRSTSPAGVSKRTPAMCQQFSHSPASISSSKEFRRDCLATSNLPYRIAVVPSPELARRGWAFAYVALLLIVDFGWPHPSIRRSGRDSVPPRPLHRTGTVGAASRPAGGLQHRRSGRSVRNA